MAIQGGLIKVTGTLNDGVGYRVDGKFRMRKKARKVKRSQATKLSANDFGTASKAGKLIRRGVKQALDIRTDNKLTNRMNKALLPLLYASSDEHGKRSFDPRKLSRLEGFQFNQQTGIGQLLPFNIKVKQDGSKCLRITLPALTARDFKSNSKTTHIEVKAIAVNVNFNEDYYSEAVSDKVLYDFKQPAEIKELILPFEAGKDETIVVLQITAYSEMYGRSYQSGNKKFCAADIIDVIPSLQVEEDALVHRAQVADKPLFQLHGDHTSTIPQRE